MTILEEKANVSDDNKANEDRCTCEEGGREEAPCPYECEINEADGDQAYCRCCPYCRQQCAESI